MRELISKYGILIVLGVMVAIMSFLSPRFLTVSNFFNISRQISVMAIVAVGMTFVILSAGIDLSVGSIVALTGIMVSFFIQRMDLPIFIAVFGGLAVGLTVGLGNGILIAKVRIPFFIVTLATMVIGRGLCFIITGGFPISQLGTSFQQIGRGYVGFLPVPVIIMFMIYALAYLILHHTSFGRYVYAIGGNEEAAKLIGLPVDRIKMFIYGICGLTSGIAALILTSRMNSGDPNMGTGMELDAIAAAVIGGTSITGGKGWIWGTLIGAYIMGILNNGLNMLDVSAYYQMAIKGLVILLAVQLQRGMETK
ncbi:MAG: ribose ABC transporter permease [candidate division KSB1 bacterium]|jgi:ribose transport system permease protein|nr:ribose ABC transporter permease [candidate division KSB1 bacterium]